MGKRKFGVHFLSPVPNLAADPPILIGDAVVPPIKISNLEVELPCGADEVVKALEKRGITFLKEGRQPDLIGEMLTDIQPLVEKMQIIIDQQDKPSAGKKK